MTDKEAWVATLDIRCKRCDKTPDKIMEYILEAVENGCTPRQYVIKEEGTFNAMTGKFWCTDCYIKLGMPDGIA